MELFTLDLNKLSTEEFEIAYSLTDNERRSYINRAVNTATKKARIAADMLARKALSEFCRIPQNEIVFSKNKFGKPYADNCDAFFSISHSGDWVICAVDSNEIGADIEKIRPLHANIAKRIAAPQETDFVNNAPENLFKLWVLKEAYFKCIGTGIGSDIKDVWFNINSDKIECSEDGYEFKFLPSPEGYVAASCIKTR